MATKKFDVFIRETYGPYVDVYANPGKEGRLQAIPGVLYYEEGYTDQHYIVYIDPRYDRCELIEDIKKACS